MCAGINLQTSLAVSRPQRAGRQEQNINIQFFFDTHPGGYVINKKKVVVSKICGRKPTYSTVRIGTTGVLPTLASS
jgi:hypothetical protein